jgi:DNA-binding transcriptional ArsR family regulator
MPARRDRLSAVAHAIADPTRRALLRASSHGERRVRDLARRHPGVTLAAVSKHLQVLEEAGLIRKRRAGRDVLCRADLRPLELLERFTTRYTRFWSERIDELERHLRFRTGSRSVRR